MRRVLFACALLLCSALSANAVQPNEMLANPVLEARARALSANLRCLVCQNESIDESDASLAHDIRIFLRERLVAGDTDAQAVQAIVNRYGEFVLLDPPVRPATYVLWFAPLGILLAGGIGTIAWMRRSRRDGEAAAPLSAAEQQRLDIVLQESER